MISQVSILILCFIFTQQQQFLQINCQTHKSNLKNSEQVGVDDILRDTFGLLDVLDQKLQAVKNRSLSASLRDNLRSNYHHAKPLLSPRSDDEKLVNDEALVKLASDFSSGRKNEHQNHQPSGKLNLDSMQVAASDPQPEIVHAKGDEHSIIDPEALVDAFKRSRQLMPDDNNYNGHNIQSDPTDKHIKFTLDLMQSIFKSQSYSAETNSIDSFLVSPLSVQMVLMMMHLGARGQTRREIGNALHLGPQLDKFSEGGVGGGGQMTSSIHHHQSMELQSNKLKRRHQQQSASATGGQSESTKPRNSGPTLAPMTTNAHELFGNAMRNLLKDPIVMKALNSANQILLQKSLPLSPQFSWAIKNYYGAEMKQVDFMHQPESTATSSNSTSQTSNNNSEHNIQQMVNEWVERQSKGRISNFLQSPVSTSTLLMAINVLFFKGDWQYKFDPAETQTDATFTQANGKTVKVPMMVNKLPLAFAHDPAMRTSVIELPYKAQRLGLFLLLPDEVSGIFHTMQMLNSTSFANLISSMRRPAPSSSADLASNEINVRIPKFSIESSPRLSQTLSQYMGLKSLFMQDVADLSGMFTPANQTPPATSGGLQKRRAVVNGTANGSNGNKDSNLQVGLDELLHKAVLQVDEQGSVAAASSAAIVERVGLFNSNYFEADHPFLLFLMDKQTGLVLFSGVFAGDKGTSNSAPATPLTDSNHHLHHQHPQTSNSTSSSTGGNNAAQPQQHHQRRSTAASNNSLHNH